MIQEQRSSKGTVKGAVAGEKVRAREEDSTSSGGRAGASVPLGSE